MTDDYPIDTLLSERGCWAARYGDVEMAFTDLNEALNLAVSEGCRIDEADIRVGLAWAHLAKGNYTSARTQATGAYSMSADMSYHWGKVDATEVLEAIEKATHSVFN